MKFLFTAFITLAAVGASAAISLTTQRIWKLEGVGEFSPFEVVLTTSEDGIKLRAGGVSNRFAHAVLTKDEAASLGRALLDAAGQPEKVCPPTSCGVITTTPVCAVFQGYGVIPANASPLNTEAK